MGLLILLAAGAVVVVVVGTLGLVHAMLHPTRKTFAYALAHGLPSDPLALELRAHETTFNFHDGSHSPGWLIDGLRPDGPVIIVTHGWRSSRYTNLPKAVLLAQLASLVVLYDMRGHGDSTAPICRLGTTEVEDLLLVVEQTPKPDRPIVLFGSSMGAGVSIAAAARSGNQPIAGVIAEAPYRHGTEPVVGHFRLKHYPSFPFVSLAWWYVAFWLGGFRNFDRVRHAERLTCPLLALRGTHDKLCRADSARQIALAAPQGELAEFDGAGHGHLAAFDPPRYLETIERFLKKLDRFSN